MRDKMDRPPFPLWPDTAEHLARLEPEDFKGAFRQVFEDMGVNMDVGESEVSRFAAAMLRDQYRRYADRTLERQEQARSAAFLRWHASASGRMRTDADDASASARMQTHASASGRMPNKNKYGDYNQDDDKNLESDTHPGLREDAASLDALIAEGKRRPEVRNPVAWAKAKLAALQAASPAATPGRPYDVEDEARKLQLETEDVLRDFFPDGEAGM